MTTKTIISALAFAAIGLGLSGCATLPPSKESCTVTGWTFELLPPDKVTDYCKSVLLSAPDDGGQNDAEVLGCTSYEEKRVVLPNTLDWSVIKHEMRHVLTFACPKLGATEERKASYEFSKTPHASSFGGGLW